MDSERLPVQSDVFLPSTYPVLGRLCLESWTPGALALKIRNSGAAKAKKKKSGIFPKRTPNWPANEWKDLQGPSKAGNAGSNTFWCFTARDNYFENQKIPKRRRVVNSSGSGASLSGSVSRSAIPSCVIWGWLLHLSVPPFLHLSNGDGNCFYLSFLGGFHEFSHVKCQGSAWQITSAVCGAGVLLLVRKQGNENSPYTPVWQLKRMYPVTSHLTSRHPPWRSSSILAESGINWLDISG